ncbi:hypothetical protein PJ311_07025 [Bacillus sp. CLL-7-23]|uniref:ABC transporter permease n=1 Tax=Bacillus changyiensis TaxID=3004103 RepID=A0ABT4X3P6_9BACI|nr:hypothetical protein [Bacillus changyiensis]MDA7026369.1 hypothetical protein [Bacillus changyiensis]
MNDIKLEYRLLQKDLVKVVLVSMILPVLNMIIYSKNETLSSHISSADAVILLFGSVKHFIMNWIYWIVFCVGYIFLLQVIWKPHIHMFHINQLLRHKSTSRFWMTKLLSGFLFTCFYVCCALFVALMFCWFFKTANILDPIWLLAFVCLVINLYFHSVLWLLLKIYSMVEVANVVILALFYAGVQLANPFLPLYYGMFSHLQSLTFTFMIECLLIMFMGLLILRKAKKMDYH